MVNISWSLVVLYIMLIFMSRHHLTQQITGTIIPGVPKKPVLSEVISFSFNYNVPGYKATMMQTRSSWLHRNKK